MKSAGSFDGVECWHGVFAHGLPPSAPLGTRAMAPRKRALIMLRQQFVLIKAKRPPAL